jgi:hypothetical protein
MAAFGDGDGDGDGDLQSIPNAPACELRFTHKSTQHFGSGARGACKQRQTMLTSRNFIACDV